MEWSLCALIVSPAATRGGRRRLQTVELCGRPCCSNKVNLREGGRRKSRAFKVGLQTEHKLKNIDKNPNVRLRCQIKHGGDR